MTAAATIKNFLAGFRLMDGSDLNKMVSALNNLQGNGSLSFPTTYHTGQVGANSATMGTDKTPVTTETYLVQLFVPDYTLLTGIAVLNGSLVAGNITVGLATSAGVPIAAAKSASTAAAGAAGFQLVPFATAYAAAPGKYFLQLQSNNTGYRFRAHAAGAFPAGKQTTQTYGTLASFTPPTTFTADLGPIATSY